MTWTAHAPSLALYLLSFLVAATGTGLLRRYAVSHSLLDHPNARSSHTTPTPRGGGLALIGSFCLTWLASMALPGLPSLPPLPAIVMLATILAVAAIGWRDDHGGGAIGPRLGLHLIAATAAAAALGAPAPLRQMLDAWSLAWLALPLTTLALAWAINLYNFMDGLDGLAATQALFISLAAAWLGEPGSPVLVALLVLASATGGFLVFNWPPAKIFMGDVGSGALGLALAALLLAQHHWGHLSLTAALILFGVFLVDASLTLTVRFVRGDRWYEGHRTHAYQHAARRLGGHRPVSVVVALINLLWLLPLAWLAQTRPDWRAGAAVLALLPLALLAWSLGAGRNRP